MHLSKLENRKRVRVGVGGERGGGDSTQEERNQMSNSKGERRKSDGERKDERGISGGVRKEHIIPGALCLSSPLMSLIKASSNISALPWSAISKATL